MVCVGVLTGSNRTSRTSLWTPTCMDELDVSLQVAVDHEHLIAARMGAWPLLHVLMMLLDVFLKGREVMVGTRTFIWVGTAAGLLTFNPSGAL